MPTDAASPDLSGLPPEYRAAFEAQQAQIASLAEQNSGLATRNARLEHLVQEFQQALYGRRSEKLEPDARQLAFEDLEAALAEEEAQGPSASGPPPTSLRRTKRNIGHLPRELPRIERRLEPESTLCSCGCGMQQIGEDRSERLDIVPAQVRVFATRRPRYACPACDEDGVRQAKAPAYLIEGGLPTEGALAQVLVSKYADHAPSIASARLSAAPD